VVSNHYIQLISQDILDNDLRRKSVIEFVRILCEIDSRSSDVDEGKYSLPDGCGRDFDQSLLCKIAKVESRVLRRQAKMLSKFTTLNRC